MGCNIGKRCGATCITRGDACELELGAAQAKALSQVRDWVERLKPEVFGNFKQLDTPEKAVAWLNENVDTLAKMGLTDELVNDIIKHRPEFITVGVEPHSGPEESKALMDTGLKVFKGDSPYKDDIKKDKMGNSQATGPMADLIFKVNSYKFALETSEAAHRMDPNFFTHKISNIGTDMGRNAIDVKRIMTALEDSNRIKSDGSITTYGSQFLNDDNMRNWKKVNSIIYKNAGLSTAIGVNPSGLWKPSQMYTQFDPLFKAADKNPGPFKNDSSWYKYSTKVQQEQFLKIIQQAQPKLIYFAKSGNGPTQDAMTREIKKGGSFKVTGRTAQGKDVVKTFDYLLYKQPDGSNTVLMFGPHPSPLGVKGPMDIMAIAGKAAKSLRETGELPINV